ncbi:unnamed protein product [Blepharisma stoltei]|uniref:Uncharacterized protein n=1 Tax=Blepharisma stoltei TaxID=1481888 RepID=A0AAU9KM36_9CILI|nr:unnamed protein product [Blepharisma stoltei]
MLRPQKDFSSKPQNKSIKGPLSVTNARKPIFKAKRFLISGTTARTGSLASARDLDECLESSVERKLSNADSGGESPKMKPPKLPLSGEDSVKKNLNFDAEELGNNFSLLMTPSGHESFGKRKMKDDGEIVEGKRAKNGLKKFLKALYDPDLGQSEYYRVYQEEEIVSDREIQQNIIKSEIDEDCPTNDSQIEICIEYLAAQVEEAILNEK